MTEDAPGDSHNAFDKESWDNLLPLDTFPDNRRAEQRRGNQRRENQARNYPSRRHPIASDRRQLERRGVHIRIPIHSSASNTYQYLRNLANWTRLLPAIRRLEGAGNDIWNVEFDVTGALVTLSLRISYRDSLRTIAFRRVGGQIDNCDGEIIVSEMPGATLVTVNLYLNFGFGAFERFMGHVIKAKTGQFVENALRIVKSKLENSSPLPPKFAFLLHSTDLGMYGEVMRDKPCPEDKKQLLEQLCGWLPPFKGSHIYGIETPAGRIIEGDFIYSTLTPRLIMEGDQQTVLRHMIQAGRLAEELGAKILGLGAYAALIGHRGAQIAEALSIPVTTGSAYTVWSAMDALCQASTLVGMKVKDSVVAIIGATGTLAGTCSEILAPGAGEVILVARHVPKLEALADKLRAASPHVRVEISTEIDKAVARADVILICTSAPDILLDVRLLKPGVVVCDLSQPKNVSQQNAETRKDVLVIDGGVIRPPGDVRFNFYFGLPPGRAFACMAETMILTLEERFESYSIGGNISTEKVKEIGLLAEKHGFHLGDLKSFGKTVNTEDLERIKKARQ